jgi:hypothetical protein
MHHANDWMLVLSWWAKISSTRLWKPKSDFLFVEVVYLVNPDIQLCPKEVLLTNCHFHKSLLMDLSKTSNLVLSSHLCLIFQLVSSIQVLCIKSLCIYLPCACCMFSHPWFNHTTNIKWKKYNKNILNKLWSFSLCNFFHPPVVHLFSLALISQTP